MSETYEKTNGNLAVTIIVDEQTLLNDLVRQEGRKARAQAAIDILNDKLVVINA